VQRAVGAVGLVSLHGSRVGRVGAEEGLACGSRRKDKASLRHRRSYCIAIGECVNKNAEMRILNVSWIWSSETGQGDRLQRALVGRKL